VLPDNGGPITTTDDGIGARNWPLRGGKHSIWEGGVRGIAVFSAPGMASAQRSVVYFLIFCSFLFPRTLGGPSVAERIQILSGRSFFFVKNKLIYKSSN
jgi:hypothetical protein